MDCADDDFQELVDKQAEEIEKLIEDAIEKHEELTNDKKVWDLICKVMIEELDNGKYWILPADVIDEVYERFIEDSKED